jgi:hypothetical protein
MEGIFVNRQYWWAAAAVGGGMLTAAFASTAVAAADDADGAVGGAGFTADGLTFEPENNIADVDLGTLYSSGTTAPT